MTGTKVLSLVDDDASVRQATGKLIRSLGFRVEVFASGKEFLRFGNLQDTFCLVLDVHMPEMNGLEIQSYLAGAGFRIPIIFITARCDEWTRARALGAGAVDFLQKPVSEEALLVGIHSALKLAGADGQP